MTINATEATMTVTGIAVAARSGVVDGKRGTHVRYGVLLTSPGQEAQIMTNIKAFLPGTPMELMATLVAQAKKVARGNNDVCLVTGMRNKLIVAMSALKEAQGDIDNAKLIYAKSRMEAAEAFAQRYPEKASTHSEEYFVNEAGIVVDQVAKTSLKSNLVSRYEMKDLQKQLVIATWKALPAQTVAINSGKFEVEFDFADVA